MYSFRINSPFDEHFADEIFDDSILKALRGGCKKSDSNSIALLDLAVDSRGELGGNDPELKNKSAVGESSKYYFRRVVDAVACLCLQ